MEIPFPVFKEPFQPFSKPYNPVRHLTRRAEILTIAMAIRCKDGVVVASDRRGLGEGGMTEDIAKIYEVENMNRSLLAFSTDSFDWLGQFLDILSYTRTTKGDLEAVKLAQRKYNKYVRDNFRNYPKKANFGGIFATLDKDAPRIFQFSGQTQPFEESANSRIVIGSGSYRGLVFFRIAEFMMKKVHPVQVRRRWANYSTEFAAAFCNSLLQTIPSYDATVRGVEIWRIRVNNESGEPERSRLYSREIEKGKNHISALLQALKDEVSPSDFLKLQEEFEILPPLLTKAFSDYAKENQTWV